MKLTTVPRPLDLAQLFPGLAAHARTATRLHPRPGVPSISGSHVGGPLLWPADEAWPRCAQPHRVEVRHPVPPEEAARLGSRPDPISTARRYPGYFGVEHHAAGTHLITHVTRPEPVSGPLLPVAQLRAQDVPDLPLPAGKDLLQVLWCPHVHPEVRDQSGPAVRLRWRAQADICGPSAAAPAPVREPDEMFRPRACVLYPEQVVEYPWWQELPEQLGRQVRAFDDSREFGQPSYYAVSQARGWKVGGHANWGSTDRQPMTCEGCSREMTLVLSMTSSESFGGTWRTEQEADLEPSWTDPRWRDADRPTGVSVGWDDALRIFACLSCPGTPFRLNAQ
ncbi:hypothetical protein [Catellatospora vulcania]|uniref:hypothetical protein n=1 Tax=Catellatospora vulcania TaxID=1460450 RepID=UPI0012D443BC|nr:hypothetical protein [Catellatospora vulcania]